MRLGRHAVPAADRNAALVEHRFDPVAGQHGVAAFDVAEVLEDRLRRQAAAAGAEVPLQVADPEHQFGDGGGARVEFEAEELVRVDGQTFGFEALLAAPEGVQLVEHLAFEALHVFERDVEEIRRAAGRVEDANLAQAVVEGVDLGARGVELAFVGEEQRRRLDVAPFAPQRLDDGRQDETFDVGARRVVGAERVSLAGRQRAFEQGAEDRRFDLRPVGVRGLQQQADLLAVQGDHFRLLEELAVEARQRRAQDDREAAAVHLAPQRGEQRDELLRTVLQRFEQGGERTLAVLPGQQADVFGEHREQAAGEETGDEFGVMAGAFERPGDARQMAGDLARDPRRGTRRVERQRVAPQHPQALAEAAFGEVGEPDAVRTRVGEGGIGGAGAREVGVQLDDLADIDDDQERRPALVGRQRAGVAFGLAARPLQGVVETLAGDVEADLLGFENEMAALVAVDASVRRTAVTVAKTDPALEDVGVVAGIVARRVGGGDVEQPAEVGDEELVVGQLGTVGRSPAGDEGGGLRRLGIGARAGFGHGPGL